MLSQYLFVAPTCVRLILLKDPYHVKYQCFLTVICVCSLSVNSHYFSHQGHFFWQVSHLLKDHVADNTSAL